MQYLTRGAAKQHYVTSFPTYMLEIGPTASTILVVHAEIHSRVLTQTPSLTLFFDAAHGSDLVLTSFTLPVHPEQGLLLFWSFKKAGLIFNRLIPLPCKPTGNQDSKMCCISKIMDKIVDKESMNFLTQSFLKLPFLLLYMIRENSRDSKWQLVVSLNILALAFTPKHIATLHSIDKNPCTHIRSLCHYFIHSNCYSSSGHTYM